MTFPPIPVYPLALDSDKTLFTVYNTSEAPLTADNLPWSQEVWINPVSEDQEEIWGDNGFANLSGELFYYDSVDKNSDGKVYKLKRCARNLGGKQTQLNTAGTWVRGFVIAEHHNQIVQAILNVEQFVGINFSEDRSTLDWRIRHLNAEPIGDDDFQCPNIVLEFNITEPSTDGSTGTTISYDLTIVGFFKTFLLDFGDGNFTSSLQSGTHTYAPNAIIDPVVTVSNDNCQVVQTAITRDNPKEPTVATPPTTFEINVPEPIIPTITVPSITVPSVTLTLPQIQFPCELGIGPIGPIGSIPSIIEIIPTIPSVISITSISIPPTISIIGDIPSIIDVSVTGELPSIIVFGPSPTFPSLIVFGSVPTFPTTITFGPAPTFPTTIVFGPVNVPSSIPVVFPPGVSISVTGLTINVPSVITVNDSIPSTIHLDGNVPSTIHLEDNLPSTIDLKDNLPSTISVTDNLPSTIEITGCHIPSTIQLEGSLPSVISIIGHIPSSISVDWGSPPSVGVDWGSPPTVHCEVTVSCPSSSPMRASAFKESAAFIDPFAASMDITSQDIGIPSEIRVIPPKMPDVRVIHDMPATINVAVPVFPDIKIIGPDVPIPSEIRIYSDTVIPSSIQLVSDLPSAILLDISDLKNTTIKLELPDKMPTIQLEGDIPKTIQVVGIPDHIELKGYIPSEININTKPLENLEIPIVFKGSSIPVRFESLTPSDGEDRPCFALVPCGK
jgi:PKD repeat protein